MNAGGSNIVKDRTASGTLAAASSQRCPQMGPVRHNKTAGPRRPATTTPVLSAKYRRQSHERAHPTAERTSCVDQEPGLRPASGQRVCRRTIRLSYRSPATQLGESLLGVFEATAPRRFQGSAHGMSPSAARLRRRHLTRWRSRPRSAPAAQPLPSLLLSDVRFSRSEKPVITAVIGSGSELAPFAVDQTFDFDGDF